MVSEKYNFKDFVEAVKDLNFPEMICLTDQEATSAERLAIKAYGPEDLKDSACGRYSTELKSFIIFLRHGIKSSNIKAHNLENIVLHEPLSKRFSLVKLKAGDNFNHRHTMRIPRIEI